MNCNPLNCDSCYNAEYWIGPDGIVIPSKFSSTSPEPTYYLWLRNKFDTIFSNQITINNDGTFFVIPDNYPEGMFYPFDQYFVIWLTTDIDGEDLVPIPMGVSPELYCVGFKIQNSI